MTVPIAEIAAATPRSSLLALDLGSSGLDFTAGQAVIVGPHGQGDRRPYSIACSPERAAETGRLELLIALDPGGDLGASLAAAAPGTLVDIEGPVGDFTLLAPTEHARLLFVAGGAGIAPLRAMLDHALRLRPTPRMSLLYSARRADDFAFIDEFRRHAAEKRVELHQTVTRDDSATWAGRRGRIGPGHFAAVLHEPSETLCFVCGPTALVNESMSTLKALGVPEGQIRTEQWEPGEEADP